MKLHPIQKDFVEGRGYSREDWDAVDSPELTDDELSSMRSFKDDFPDIHALIEAEVAKENNVQRISLVLDEKVITHFKTTGKGWQQRINDILRKELAI